MTPELLSRRVLGRGDVRRRAALPARGPVGAARRAALQHAGPVPADAAARPQHGRLHAVPDQGHHLVRGRGGRGRHRHLPDLRRAERRRADAAGDRGGPRDRHHDRRGRALLHRRPERPGRDALHPGLLPAAGRADRRRRRARPGDQGHGRAAAAAGRDASWSRRCGSASTCRCTCTPTTPPAASWPPCWPRSTPGWTRSTWRSAPMAGTTSPAAGVGPGRRAGQHRAGDQPRPARGDGPGAVLGGGAQGLRAVRVRAAEPDRPGVRPRDPRRPAVQPAPAGDRARAGRAVRADRGDVRRRAPDPRPADQGDPVVQGGRRPRAAPGGGRGRPGGLRGEPAELRHPRLGDRLPRAASWATRPAAGRSRSGPRRCRAARSRSATSSCPRRTRPRSTSRARCARRRSTGCCSRARPRTSPRARETYGDVGRLDTLDYLYGLRTGDEHIVRLGRGRQPDPRAGGDRRARRARHAHRDVHDQRPAAADPGPRHLGQGRRQGGREGRPDQARATSPHRSPAWSR